MNHSFQSTIGGTECNICKRDKISHTGLAQCESCSIIGPCELIDDILMCKTCQKRDIEVKTEVGTLDELEEHQLSDKQAKVAQLVNRLSKEIPLDRRSYFVGRITSIVDIESQLIEAGEQNPHYKLAEILEQNIVLMRSRIIEKHSEIREMQAQTVADQKYLNQLVPQLREEEREKFKSYDISYNPVPAQKPTATASKPRQSASEKAYEQYAKTLGISVELAKKVMQAALQNVTGAQCTCAETPGICKVHPK